MGEATDAKAAEQRRGVHHDHRPVRSAARAFTIASVETLVYESPSMRAAFSARREWNVAEVEGSPGIAAFAGMEYTR